MATTYTTNYHLGKQTDHADKFDMDVITDNMDILDEALGAVASEIEDARGTYDTLDDRMDAQDEMITVNRAALVDVVDDGAKNIFPVLFTSKAATVSNPSCTKNADGTITLNGARVGNDAIIVYDLSSDLTVSTDTRYTLPAGKYVSCGGTNKVKVQVLCHDGTNTQVLANAYLNAYTFEYTADLKRDYPYIVWRLFIKGSSAFDNEIIYPMICSKAAWDISQAYQPYRKDLAELTVDSDEDRAALVELVDNGAKNILDLTKATEVVKADELSYTLAADGTLTVTWTADLSSSGKTIQFKGFPYKAGTYILSGAQLDGSSTAVRAEVREGSTTVVMDYGQSPTPFELPSNGYNYVIRVQAPAGSATFKPMICTEAAWDISHAYQHYRPSEDEQNAQIANNGLTVVLSQQSNSSSTYTYQMKSSDFPVPYSCGCYLISIITWGTTPAYSLYFIAYSGNHTDYTVITKIAGSDANVSVSGDTISVTSSGKVTIMAMK